MKKIFSLNIFVLLLLILGIIIILIFTLRAKKSDAASSISSSTQLTDHPIYSSYNFIENGAKINIGIQPMYLPTGIIFEAIKRDEILKTALAESGKEIEYYSFLKGADVNYFLQKNLLDGGVGGDMPALSAAASSDVIIPVILQKGNVSIVSYKPTLTKDLKGKRIGYPYGSISHYFILELLKSSGIPEEKVKLIPMEVSQMAEALDKRKIDLFSAWEPSVTEAINLHPEFYITFKKITTGYLYFQKTFIQENPRINDHLLASVIRSINWLRSDRQNLLLACEWNLIEIEKLTGKKSHLTPEILADVALKDILGYNSKYAIVINNKAIRNYGSLHKEYEFLASLTEEKENNGWDQVAKSFDLKMIRNILKHPIKNRLNEYKFK